MLNCVQCCVRASQAVRGKVPCGVGEQTDSVMMNNNNNNDDAAVVGLMSSLILLLFFFH